VAEEIEHFRCSLPAMEVQGNVPRYQVLLERVRPRVGSWLKTEETRRDGVGPGMLNMQVAVAFPSAGNSRACNGMVWSSMKVMLSLSISGGEGGVQR
jgi:hypothetical protein